MATKKLGIVTKATHSGTATVTVERSVVHPLYKKRYPVSKKFLVDPAGIELSVGDMVRIEECRPLSKRKCFRVVEVLRRAPKLSELQEEAATMHAIQGSTPSTS